MANAFEKSVLQYDLITEIKLLVNPPQKPIFRGDFTISPDFKISRWILPSGKVEFVENPKKFETNTVSLKVKSANGDILEYVLKLPFNIIDRIEAVPRMAVDRGRYAEQAKKKILAYLKELSENVAINPEFESYLYQIGATYEFNPDIKIEEEQTSIPVKTLPEINKQITFDIETLIKLFFKISWTHAVRQLGLDQLSNPISNWILKYLTEGHVVDRYLTKKYKHLFTKPISIDGEFFIFWKQGLDETRAIIENVEDQQDKIDLLRIFLIKYENYKIAKNLIQFNFVEIFDYDELNSRISDFRFHNLALVNRLNGDQETTFCDIQLFGGLLNASIRLSESTLSKLLPEDIRIEF
jgi:hypothetical protein